MISAVMCRVVLLCPIVLFSHSFWAQVKTSNAGQPELAREMLAAHNAVRDQVAVPPLVWSTELSEYAQQWADTLLKKEGFSHRGQRRYGENLFEISGQYATPEEVVSAWAAEARSYNYKTNTCSRICGHYTQVVWRDTKTVGCGVARNKKRELWVCNYDPPGNIIGERPY